MHALQGAHPSLQLDNGYRKANVINGSSANSSIYLGFIYANNRAVHVDKRPPAVARVYRRVRLEKINARDFPSGRDDAACHSQIASDSVRKREAKGKHFVAHPGFVGVPYHDVGESVFAIYLDKRKVGSYVSLNHITAKASSTCHPYGHGACSIDNMLVGYYYAISTDYEACPVPRCSLDLDYARLDALDEVGK